jgi:hypothetical protein
VPSLPCATHGPILHSKSNGSRAPATGQ